ncbi:hypothetical protein [Limnofasciculus baicalensis]|uniref:Uncharacterized protein n=1 Tax=Limnofasciculus baicalensis BBK-W-15 TaxID=2699891 RepID=A0AAE3GSX2_9CYAN|nr:hypothetical protein [Limnofasciculus baicalensis]MCP2729949.1 hypothetical protein [Limnofasciculus baicalensis BBK-W-15]
MRQFNYFKKISKYGNNFFSLMFVIPLALHNTVLMTPTDYHGKTTESFQENTRKTKIEPLVFPLAQVNLVKSLEENKKNQSPENKNEETIAKQNPTKPTVLGNDLLKELRNKVRRDLLASGTNSEAVVDQTLNSLPIEELSNSAFFFNRGKLKAGTIGSLAISQNSIARTYSQYLEPILTVELGFKIERIKGGYGGENLYKIRNDEGVEFYLSLIGFGSFNSQTFVVLWEKDPRSL